MTDRAYQLLAIDIDGTLLGHDQTLDEATIEALRLARRAGLKVCLATGRNYHETVGIWRKLAFEPPFEPIVLIGGALVSEPDTGRTLYQRSIALDKACQVTEAFTEAGLCSLAMIDVWRWGWDGVVCGRGPVDAGLKRWLDRSQAKVRFVERLADVPDMPDPLRINAVADSAGKAQSLVQDMTARLAGQVKIYSMPVPSYGVITVEAFDARADKWTALTYVAQGWRIGPGRIVAVGDEVNDEMMVRQAGLGVAMGHGAEALRAVADCVIEDGLGRFVRRLIDGHFDKGSHS